MIEATDDRRNECNLLASKTLTFSGEEERRITENKNTTCILRPDIPEGGGREEKEHGGDRGDNR